MTKEDIMRNGNTRIKAKQTGKGKYKGIMTKDRYKGDIQMKKGNRKGNTDDKRKTQGKQMTKERYKGKPDDKKGKYRRK